MSRLNRSLILRCAIDFSIVCHFQIESTAVIASEISSP